MSRSHINVAFAVEREGWIECLFRYYPPLIDSIKASIPATRRQWKENRNCWAVRESEKDTLLACLDKNGYDVEYLYTEQQTVPDAVKEDRELAVLGLRVGASLALVKAAYRVKSLENHPDRGGSNEVMSKINEAYSRLEGRYGAK